MSVPFLQRRRAGATLTHQNSEGKSHADDDAIANAWAEEPGEFLLAY